MILEDQIEIADCIEDFQEVVHILVLAIEHNLEGIKQSAEEQLNGFLGTTEHLFSVATLCIVVPRSR